MMIPYGKHRISESDIQSVIETLQSDYLTQGPKIQELEQLFCDYLGTKYAVAVSNGTAALHLATLALGKENPRIITTPITFVATANCALYCQGEVEFVDIDPNTLCLDPVKLEAKLKAHPKGYFTAIYPVSMAGYPAPLERIHQLAVEYGCFVVEDACHAIGAKYHQQQIRSGSCQHSDMAVFSLHPVKHIAAGEGGIITTNSKELYERMELLRSHGITKNPAFFLQKADGPWYHEMQELGVNYRMSDIHAALACSQFQNLDENIQERNKIADTYNEAFKDLPLGPCPTASTNEILHAFHLYVIRTQKRDELFSALREQHILAQVHYIPVHTQPYYKKRYGKQSFEQAEKYYRECLSLPMYPGLDHEQQERVIETVKKFLTA